MLIGLSSIIFILHSCGKDMDESSSHGNNNNPRNPQSERRNGDSVTGPYANFINKQQLTCVDVGKCPESVAKLVVIDSRMIRFCTGILIEDNKMVTSASCLPRSLRIPRLDCSENIFAVFPRTIDAREDKVACDKVEFVDNNLFKEPALWYSDFAVISLKGDIKRKAVRTSTRGMRDKIKYTAWKIDYESDFVGTLKEDKCQTIHNSYLNPFSASQYSPMLVATECDFNDGNIGTPIMDGEQLAGIYSTEMSSRIYNYLRNSDVMIGSMNRYYHISNLSCLNVGDEYFSRVISDDCLPIISSLKLDQLRENILKGKKIHEKKMEEVRAELESHNKYFKWNVNFYTNRWRSLFEAHINGPKCIHNAASWIDQYRTWRGAIRSYARVSIRVPKYTFKTKLNKYLRPVSHLEESEEKLYDFEFNPFNAYVKENTTVRLRSTLMGQSYDKTFQEVTAECE